MTATRLCIAVTALAVAAAGCGGGSRPRDDDQAKLPVESRAVGGGDDCERGLPTAAGDAVPPAGTPFLAESVWFGRETTAGSDVFRAYAPAATPRLAADELLTQIRRGGFTVEGENAEEGRATITYRDGGRGVSVIVTRLCEGYAELAYHFPLPAATASPS